MKRNSKKGATWIELISWIWAVVLFFLISSRGVFVLGDGKAVGCLKDQGYTDIKVVDKDWFMIGFRGGEFSDAVRFEVIATNSSGSEVKIYVFSGWFLKGQTIRTIY